MSTEPERERAEELIRQAQDEAFHLVAEDADIVLKYADAVRCLAEAHQRLRDADPGPTDDTVVTIERRMDSILERLALLVDVEGAEEVTSDPSTVADLARRAFNA